MTDPRETGCEHRKWKELAQEHVQWQTLVLLVLDYFTFCIIVSQALATAAM
jgi:hypothetical protein